MINYQRALEQGLGFEVLDRLSSHYQTYKVRRNKRVMVAKLSPCDRRVSYYRDLDKEADELKIAHDSPTSPILGDFPLIPELINLKYGLSELIFVQPRELRRKSNAFLAVLLRDYIDGEILDRTRILNQTQKSSLRNTVSSIHNSGLCGLDLSNDNIVIQSTTGLPFLLDISPSFKKENLDSESAEKFESRDLEAIEYLGKN